MQKNMIAYEGNIIREVIAPRMKDAGRTQENIEWTGIREYC